MTTRTALVWFRRDLRAFDHAALYHALRENDRVVCVFIFDREILDVLPTREDRRVEFIWESVRALDAALAALGGGLHVEHATAQEAIPRIAQAHGARAVYANHDDEPGARARDENVKNTLKSTFGADFKTFKDHVIFERSEVLTQSGTPFSVFTPYKNAWLKQVNSFYLKSYPVEQYAAALAPKVQNAPEMPTLEAMGFARTNLAALKVPTGASGGAQLFADFIDRIDRYDESRNFPAVKGPSYLSVHLRFGTVSIRQLAAHALARWRDHASAGAGTWLSELIWRDFYVQILHHHPRVVSRCFKAQYDAIAWKNDAQLFAAWCEGRTGYPIVDAAMRQLNSTGYMHNRLRMIVASFLTKDLHVNWQMGEAYFAEKLIDFDLSANNGGWQWAASTGCDAQPYFRIFNPISQSEKFDAKGQFIRRYVPEIAALSDKHIHAPWLAPEMLLQSAHVQLGKTYPHPCVDHASARETTLALFAAVRD